MLNFPLRQVLHTNVFDAHKKPCHVLLYYKTVAELDAALELVYHGSCRTSHPLVVADIALLNQATGGAGQIRQQREIVNNWLETTESGTLIVKSFELTGPELQHYFKYLLDLTQKQDQWERTSTPLPKFRGRFVFTAQTDQGLTRDFLTHVGRAIFLYHDKALTIDFIDAAYSID